MKKSILFITSISIIIMVNTVNNAIAQKNNSQPAYANETIKTIHSRKSVRNYTDKTVSKEQLEMLVKAGMAAPSAMNRQPWAFIIINSRKVLDSLAAGSANAKMLSKVTAAIVVCGDTKKVPSASESGYWSQDCSAAAQNILLAAESIGLGAVWTGVYPNKERINFIRKTLNLPEHIIPLNVIPLGYPEGKDKSKDKFKPENIHWNKW